LPPEHNTPYVLENIRRAPPDRVPSPGSTAVAGWPVAPGSGVSFGGSLFHLGEHLGPGFPGAVAVPLRAPISARRFPDTHEPQIARHVFLVGESVHRSDVFRHQTVANASSTKLLENASLPGQTVAPFRAMRPWRWLGLAKAFRNSGFAWIKPIFDRFTRAAAGKSSRFISPRRMPRNLAFKRASCPWQNNF